MTASTTALPSAALTGHHPAGQDVCTVGAAQALLRPTRIHVDVSEPDEWGDVRIDVGPDERARLSAGVQWYRIDAPSSGGDPAWLTRGQLLALVAAAQALLEPRPAPRKRQAKAVAAAEPVRDLRPRLRPSRTTLNDPDWFPAHAPLHDVTAPDGSRMIDLLTSRTGTLQVLGLRDGFFGCDRSLDAPEDVPSGGHRVAAPRTTQGAHIVYADVSRENY